MLSRSRDLRITIFALLFVAPHERRFFSQGGITMRIHTIIGLVGLMVLSSAPAFAADAMMSGQSMMMKPGESMMMMPNGQTMMVPAMTTPMDAGVVAAAKPMDKCLIMMMGKDGKMMMVEDMKMADGKMACDEMSMMKK
jgi:hypothetical protein